MLKMTIDNEEVLSNNDISIKEEILSPSSTILNNVYPKSWELDKDYTSRFYYPKDYSKLNIQNFSIEPEEAGKTIQINGSATLTNVDTTKESRVLRILGQTSQTGTPTPSSPIPINVVSGDNTIDICGKNILNLGNVSGTNNNVAYSISNGQFVLNGACNSDRVTIDLPTQQALNGTYTFSTNYIKATALKNSGGTNLFLTTSSSGVKTETINDTISQLVIYGLTGVTFNNQVIQLQVEKGSTATTYEPYIGNSYPITLPSGIELCKIGTYQDYIYKDNGVWYLHKEIGKIVLNGSESGLQKSGVTTVDRFFLDIETGTLPSNTSSLCNYFSYGSSTTIGTFYMAYSSGRNASSIFVNYSTYGTTTLAQFKTWLSSNNVIAYYTLPTPTNTEITDTLLLSQLNDLESE